MSLFSCLILLLILGHRSSLPTPQELPNEWTKVPKLELPLPVEVVPPALEPTRLLIPGNEEAPTWNPDTVLSQESHSQPGVRVVTSQNVERKC